MIIISKITPNDIVGFYASDFISIRKIMGAARLRRAGRYAAQYPRHPRSCARKTRVFAPVACSGKASATAPCPSPTLEAILILEKLN